MIIPDLETYNPSVGECRPAERDQRLSLVTPELAHASFAACFKTRGKAKLVEEIWCIALDARIKACGNPQLVSKGDCDGCDISVRALLRMVLAHPLATSFMLAHNHPSGDLTMSPADNAVTRRVIIAAKTIDLALLEHLIVHNDRWLSIRQANPSLWSGIT